MSKLSMLYLVVFFFIAGCSTLKVESSFNPKTDFSGLKTYGWLSDMDKPSEDVRVNNKFVIDTVRAAVEHELNGKGLQKVSKEQADFVVTWFGAIEQQIKTENINHFYNPYGYGALYRDPYWNSQPGIANITEYEQGSLIIDFLDPRSQSLLWRGTGSNKIVDGQSESQRKKNLSGAVTQILAGFPPP